MTAYSPKINSNIEQLACILSSFKVYLPKAEIHVCRDNRRKCSREDWSDMKKRLLPARRTRLGNCT